MPSLEGSRAHESKLYYELSHLYDVFFTRVFAQRIQHLIRTLDIAPGSRVLEVGVGTGLSFEAYPTHCQVTGVDLAPEMLERAETKIAQNGWRHIRVMEMDALNLKFEDSTFDYVMAFHVVSVVPDVKRLMAEVVRVGRPGATVAIINHFRSRNPLLSAIDSISEPVTRRLGWHTLTLDATLKGVPLRVERLYKDSPRSLFTILVGRNEKAPRH